MLYPQEHERGQRLTDVKVWKKGHMGSDPSNGSQLYILVAQAR
jgi:hypothetical protein